MSFDSPLQMNSITAKISGVPYAQAKTRGNTSGPAVWSAAVVDQTTHLRKVAGACVLDVTFRLPPDKYPTDHPHGMDLDNLLKRFFDALQETVFSDVSGGDGCVIEVHARKVKVGSVSEAGVDLTIVPVGG